MNTPEAIAKRYTEAGECPELEKPLAGAIRDAIADATAEQTRRAEWQPIETAPKDGTRVFLGYDYQGFLFTASTGYWTEHNGGGWVRECMFQPTHWMRLPEPPPPPDR
jgi:hypothetical protein